MTETMTRRARLRVMHRPGSNTSHVFREDSTLSVCTKLTAGARLVVTADGVATCGGCVDGVQLAELAELARRERRVSRPALDRRFEPDELADVADVLRLVGLVEELEPSGQHVLAGVVPLGQLALW